MNTNTYPVKCAKLLLLSINNFGFDGLKAFTLTREKYQFLNDFSEDETEEEVLNGLASACWSGLDYFIMWLGDENIKYHKNQIYDVSLLNKLKNGVYYMELLGSESHYWVWVIDDDILLYARSYGGICGITVKTFNKGDYMNCFNKAMLGSLDDYNYVFQIEACVYTVGFDSITYSKSDRYY